MALQSMKPLAVASLIASRAAAVLSSRFIRRSSLGTSLRCPSVALPPEVAPPRFVRIVHPVAVAEPVVDVGVAVAVNAAPAPYLGQGRALEPTYSFTLPLDGP